MDELGPHPHHWDSTSFTLAAVLITGASVQFVSTVSLFIQTLVFLVSTLKSQFQLLDQISELFSIYAVYLQKYAKQNKPPKNTDSDFLSIYI